MQTTETGNKFDTLKIAEEAKPELEAKTMNTSLLQFLIQKSAYIARNEVNAHLYYPVSKAVPIKEGETLTIATIATITAMAPTIIVASMTI